MKKPVTGGDLSAAVTGLLLAFCLPVTTPYWVLLIGDFFAIVVVKQLYGGIGKNFMNPALAARVFLFSFPPLLNKWAPPMRSTPLWTTTAAVTSATPLARCIWAAFRMTRPLYQLFIGQVAAVLARSQPACSCWAVCSCSPARDNGAHSRRVYGDGGRINLHVPPRERSFHLDDV